jgi:hypothetical protein
VNAPFFTVCELLDDDTPGVIDYGGSASELAAARVGIRACNAERKSMCVVNDAGVIVQRIRFRPSAGAALVEDAPVLEPNRKSASRVGLLEAADLAREWAGAGYTVTISPSAGDVFNVIGRK